MKDLFEKLNELINKYDKFIIMGHKNPDLDALGSSIGLSEILKDLNKESYVFLNTKRVFQYNTTVINALKSIEGEIDFIDESNYKNVVNEKTLLIVVDVHQKDRIEFPKILDLNLDIVILDHHMKNKNVIENSILTYIDTNLSSMTELISFYADSLDLAIDSNISTIMLAGIEIDTNSYNLRTTSKTYQAASILMDMGADTILKQELLKETIDDYLKRADTIKNSFMVNSEVAMCILPSICTKEQLAEAADELLKFVDVTASFSIGKLTQRQIGVSARSLGKIDVEVIMKHFNGGGTNTNAAAQIEGKTIIQIKQEIINLLGG